MEVTSAVTPVTIYAWRNKTQYAEALSGYCLYLAVSFNIVWSNSIFLSLFKRIDGKSFYIDGLLNYTFRVRNALYSFF